MAAFILETNYPSSINSVLRQIMEQNSSEADSRLLARLEDVLTYT